MKCLILVTLWCTFINIGFSLFDFGGKPQWKTLQTTYSFDIFDKAFWHVPLTAKKAIEGGFTKISTDCKGTFYGHRYIKENDTSLILLYDDNDHIAGIQTGLPKSGISPSTHEEWFKKGGMFTEDTINGIALYTLTAYFTKPDTICEKHAEDLNVNLIGTQLTIQNKPDFLDMPMQEEDLGETAWTKGRCFPTMGVHYWYNASKEMNCDYWRPMFLLYNKGTLTGFGWVVPNWYIFSDRLEHPPKFALNIFFNPVPDCLTQYYDTVGGLTTLHVYMNTEVWNLLC